MSNACRFLIVCAAWVFLASASSAAKPEGEFRDVLTTAGLGSDALSSLAAKTEYDADQWNIISQLVYRLEQLSADQLRRWESGVGDRPGSLVRLSAIVTGFEPLPTPDAIGDDSPMPRLFRCQLEMDGARGVVLVPEVPRPWQGRDPLAEPVQMWGVALGTTPQGAQLVVTNHFAWHPEAGVPAGWLLLSRNGMDVSLLDEVRHRRPFVKPDVSREGDAFYGALAAMAQADRQELAKLALENVAAVAAKAEAAKPALAAEVAELRLRIAAEQDTAERESLRQQLSQVRRQLALAETIQRQGAKRLSAVAPMFLEPESHVGELVRIEGVARRAVRISVPEMADDATGLDGYYELEVFAPDSQNLPVVCCVTRLPESFPEGDAIREPVRVDGVFFKCWRYRSRKNLADSGETGRAAQLYTPVVVGGEPRRLPTATNVDSRWGLWGGIAFLAALAAVWIATLRSAVRDRQRRAATWPVELENLPKGP